MSSKFTFIHAADLHLDSPLRGLERYEGAPVEEMRGATRRALENIVDLCLAREARFLILAGDVYDGEWRDFQTGLFFHGQMLRLHRADIPVYLVWGNHDAASIITKELKLPNNVHIFDADKPQTFTLEKWGVALHGQSYRCQSVTENIAKHYPAAVSGCLNIGVLHTCLDGREGHANYAPCPVSDLVSKGYDYWALGHVHEAQIVREQPWIVWSGTSQGRHAREMGPKGCMEVSVEDKQIRAVHPHATDVVRWCALDCDMDGIGSKDVLLDTLRSKLSHLCSAHGERILAVRVTLRGTTILHGEIVEHPGRWEAEVRALSNECAGSVCVEKVRFCTRSPIDMGKLARRSDALGGLVRTLERLKKEPLGRNELDGPLSELRARLPHGLLSGEDSLECFSPEGWSTLVDEVEQLLVPKLVEFEEDRKR